jgi:hypothetical protein
LPVVAFERHVGDRVLSFATTELHTELEDTDTHSRWRISDGAAVNGSLRGDEILGLFPPVLQTTTEPNARDAFTRWLVLKRLVGRKWRWCPQSLRIGAVK